MIEERQKENRLLTLVVEILFAIAVAITVVLYAAHGPFPWMPQRKWIVLTMVSSAIFGVPVWWYRRYWERSFFWLAFVVLLLLHVIAYSMFLSRLKEFPPLLVPFSIALEWLVIFPLLAKAVGAGRRGTR